MNREIKFRAWDKLINKMITESNVKEIINTIQGDFNTTYVYDSDEWYPAYEIFGIFNYFQAIKEMRIYRYNEKSELRFELMQYTGLHDKNGKEIYEGDIVLLTCYNYEEPVFGGEFKVIYDDINGMWLLVDLENKDRGFAFGEIRSYYKAEFEIIGNVFEKGIKKIWELHKKGYSINKISKELNYDWLQVKTRIDEIYDNLELLGGK